MWISEVLCAAVFSSKQYSVTLNCLELSELQKLCLLNSRRPYILPTFLLPVIRNNHITHLIHFPSVSYHCPMLPNVPCQKTIVLHILSNVLIAWGGWINWVSITPPWLKIKTLDNWLILQLAFLGLVSRSPYSIHHTFKIIVFFFRFSECLLFLYYNCM